MDAKEIEERGRQLSKAASEGDPPATLLSLLDGLKTWTATEKLLRQTKIGIHVNKLRQNKDANVARTASSLVNKWKTDVKKPAAASATSSPAAAAKTVNGIASPAKASTPQRDVAAEKTKKKHKGDPEKRNATVDGVDTQHTGNQTRDNCIKLMYDGLAYMSTERMLSHSACTPPHAY